MTATLPTPSRDDFTSPDEVIVHVAADAKPDDFNRVQFTAFWLTNQEWVPGGVRGQVFTTDLDRFSVAKAEQQSTVRIVRVGGAA